MTSPKKNQEHALQCFNRIKKSIMLRAVKD